MADVANFDFVLGDRDLCPNCPKQDYENKDCNKEHEKRRNQDQCGDDGDNQNRNLHDVSTDVIDELYPITHKSKHFNPGFATYLQHTVQLDVLFLTSLDRQLNLPKWLAAISAFRFLFLCS